MANAPPLPFSGGSHADGVAFKEKINRFFQTR